MPGPIQVPSVTPKLIIDSIVQLQGLSPVQVENLLREVAAQQGLTRTESERAER